MADGEAAEMAVDSHDSGSESEDEQDAPGWTPQLIALDKQDQLEGEKLFEQKVRFVSYYAIGESAGKESRAALR